MGFSAELSGWLARLLTTYISDTTVRIAQILEPLVVSLGVLFFLLPRVTAHVFGVICAWLAIGAGREAFRRRADR